MDEPGTVLTATNAVTMGLQSTSFVGYAATMLRGIDRKPPPGRIRRISFTGSRSSCKSMTLLTDPLMSGFRVEAVAGTAGGLAGGLTGEMLGPCKGANSVS